MTDDQPPQQQHPFRFRMFFFRGLGIVLPTVLTIYLIILAYNVLARNIAEPINYGVREVVLLVSPWPPATNADYLEAAQSPDLSATLRSELQGQVEQWQSEGLNAEQRRVKQIEWMMLQPVWEYLARQQAVERWWGSYRVMGWQVLDLIGLVVAIVLVYFVGLLLGNYIGRSLYSRGERIIDRLPLVRNIYSSVKQVTDFFFGDQKQQMQFSRVVAVQYPRKGLWSVGLVTGDTMRLIQKEAGAPCLTVFVPSSPTPFTGYVITVPRTDTIDLPITIEDAIKFAVSGGVLVPPNQQISQGDFDYDAPDPELPKLPPTDTDWQNRARQQDD